MKHDLEVVKGVLEVKSEERPPFSYRINNLGLETCVLKVRKIACRALKGRGVNNVLRLVYAHFLDRQKIIFMELYHKSERSTKDRK